ncbi:MULTISPECIES: hypothetical protein [Bradyrhizobium]|uniref:hypothetical protein n=1 Tax=Bradyrhizobium TaxID=374 RepID=UPI001FE24154|nr:MULTISPECIES: hypothetical protein [Bradyrhizobium]UQR62348.1 hypothetical protein LRP30_37245 [Bradyrhizobium sp. C-145]
MSKAIRNATADPPIITVGDLIDELCRLPDTALVSFHCPMLEHELTFYNLRRRSKDVVEIEVNAYPQSRPANAA